jgi:LPXTG-motif cell wall-anchored protein
LNVKTSGLQDSADCTPKTLENATCTALLQGPNSFSAQVTGTVKGGICDVTFTASQTPKTAGTYQVVVQVAGPNGNLQTAPKDVVFVAKVVASSSSSVSSTAPTVLPRTGGIAFAIILAFLAGVGGIAAFIFARRRKMKITK